MTVEQKAEEYLTRTVCQGCRNICEGDCAYAKPVKQGFIDGYHECEKELEQKVEDLEIENAQLDNDNLVAQQVFEKNALLEAQIEKMKCCENCKYYNGGYLKCTCKEPSYSCNRIFKGGTKDLWELKND